MNLQENINRIKEVMGIYESEIPISIRRRSNPETLEKYITMGEMEYPTLCDDFGDEFEYADNVIEQAIKKFMEDPVNRIYHDDEYSDEMDYIRDQMKDLFGDYLFDIYNSTCSEEIDELDEKQEQTESEITERCWKGYTQKGMKTMFGKRYPNCVKKKK